MNEITDFIRNGQWSDLPIADDVRAAARFAFEFLTESDIFSLLFQAFILYWVGQHVMGNRTRLRLWCKTLAYFSFLAFFIYHYIQERPSGFVVIAFKAFVASFTIFGILTVVLPIIARIWTALVVWPFRAVRMLMHSVRQRFADWRWRVRKRREERRLRRAQRRIPSRAQYARQATDQAKADFALDCELIRSAGLDADEREAVLIDAKRRLVRRLHHLLQ